jgi:transposase-like protein
MAKSYPAEFRLRAFALLFSGKLNADTAQELGLSKVLFIALASSRSH